MSHVAKRYANGVSRSRPRRRRLALVDRQSLSAVEDPNLLARV
jgi:hypothetical protein